MLQNVLERRQIEADKGARREQVLQQQANGCRGREKNPLVDTSTRINWASIQHIRLSGSKTVQAQASPAFLYLPFLCGANFEIATATDSTPLPWLPQVSLRHVITGTRRQGEGCRRSQSLSLLLCCAASMFCLH